MGTCVGLTRSDPRFAELNVTIDRYRNQSGAVVYAVERARYLFGALPNQVLHYLADRLHLNPGEVYNAAFAEDRFPLRPVAIHTISICLGTHCYLAGAYALFDRLQAELGIGPGETTPDGLFTLRVCYDGEHDGDEASFFVDSEQYIVKPNEIPAVLDRFRAAPVPVGAAQESPG